MAHALLSPSGASRWLACTPSARLESQFPDKAGEAAAEGTLAHALGELILRYKLELISAQKYSSELKKIQADELYDGSMLEHAQDYAAFVLERYNDAQAHTKDAIIHLEQKLDLTAYVPEGFGTGDAVIIADGTLDLIDLKYGKGVLVDATNNKQLMLYGLGALDAYSFVYDIKVVRMTIFQPRLGNYSSFEMPVEDLFAWAENELRPRAALAFNGEGEYVPGSHCLFCKAGGACKARADFNLRIMQYDFRRQDLLSLSEISDVLTVSDELTSWVKAVGEYAAAQAKEGVKIPGFKLVEGRSNRKYADEVEAGKLLVAAGHPEEKIYNKKLLGLGDMEKYLGKTNFNTVLGPCIVKPAGAPTLVPVSDKRPEMGLEQAKKDFAEPLEA